MIDETQAVAFYDAVLGAIGYERGPVEGGWAFYGLGEAPGVGLCKPFDGRPATVGNGTMLALHASSWQQVDDFHAAALAHGGVSEGVPGLRPQYNADFYAAYVRDPDGNKLAAVCRGFTRRP